MRSVERLNSARVEQATTAYESFMQLLVAAGAIDRVLTRPANLLRRKSHEAKVGAAVGHYGCCFLSFVC
jgi:hypothetical protein